MTRSGSAEGWIVVAAAQEERFTRVKHDSSLPVRAVRWLCQHAGMRLSDGIISVSRSHSRSLSAYWPHRLPHFQSQSGTAQLQIWLSNRLWIRARRQTFSIRPEKILFGEHHLFMASAFFKSPLRGPPFWLWMGLVDGRPPASGRGENTLRPMGEIRPFCGFVLFCNHSTSVLR